jgi:clan AA aspartic protease
VFRILIALGRAAEVEMLVDTGTVFSVLPRNILKKIGVRAEETDEFMLADGTLVRYPVGEARFELEGRKGTSKVVFGPIRGTPLLGALTLESLGLMVNL